MNRTQLYLDSAIRANISSFANLASPDEVQDGLTRLTAYLRSGTFASIKARYATEEGDYAYVVARFDS